ncbi:MAG: 4Fe-4S binding protein [Desulfomicrobium escambiense]|nr:4Fe-4S binding protein [Desulfomicrobium escambiense]
MGCGLCAAICPSKCIKVYTSEGPDNTKIVDRYEVEVLRCIYCGMCYEACPYMAIMLSENYEYSVYSRQDLFMTKEKLMENWDAYMAGDKDYEFYTKFWRPKTEDFTGSENQAVFKGRR